VPEPGQIEYRRAAHGQEYYLYLPSRPGSPQALLVTVHGISRNAREQIGHFTAFAERSGAAVIAPYFSRDRYADYQRLGRLGRGERADHALESIVEEVQKLLGMAPTRLLLFGYSGGGQFVHRFAMAHPDRVAGVAAAAPGWFTFPDEDLWFPLGCRPTPELPDLSFSSERFLRVPMHVFVGSRDHRRGRGFNALRPIDLLQGRTRIERGRRWVAAMRNAAREQGLPSLVSFELLPSCGHSFEQCATRGGLTNRVLDTFFGGEKTASMAAAPIAARRTDSMQW